MLITIPVYKTIQSGNHLSYYTYKLATLFLSQYDIATPDVMSKSTYGVFTDYL